MKTLKASLISLLFISIFASCVTINVYFPAAAAQEAAKEIVEDVLKQARPETKNKTSSVEFRGAAVKLVSAIVDIIIQPASAAANISINTPKISTLRSQLKQQHNALVNDFNQTRIGYTDAGLVKLRQTDGMNLKDKATLIKQINAMNQTLNQLYREIALANQHPEWQKDIQKTFAKTWISEIQSGWVYFSGGQWKTR